MHRATFAAGLLALALLALPAGRPVASALAQQPGPEPSTLQILESAPQPLRDPAELAARLTGARVPPPVRGGSEGLLAVGRADTFYVLDQTAGNVYRQRPAELRLVTEHAYWYVEPGQPVAQDDLIRSAQHFEERTYPLVHQLFGDEWSPGIDGDPRVTIFIGTVPGVGAYFSSWDEYPRAVFPFSNEREMVHLNAGSLRPGRAGFDGTLAHEFQHMVHWHMNPADETWVDEGSAELASFLSAGGRAVSTSAFERQPDLQLTAWGTGASAGPHYQAAFLFMQYFAERFGGPDGLRGLFSEPGRPPDTFSRYLDRAGHRADFNAVFLDWVVANLIDDPGVADGRYYHEHNDPRMAAAGRLRVDDPPLAGSVHQYGADYLELTGRGDDAELSFQGDPSVPLVRVEPASGSKMWWGNRGDSLDSQMTRRFDLRGVPSAHLRFNLWYETEKDFDYFYVMGSVDGGETWQVLRGSRASDDNPSGNAVGPGYSGTSGDGPSWVSETVDLTSFAGQEVLIRFEYVTDQAFNARGVLLDDVEVPEVGFFDDAESERGWHYNGFIRSDNVIPQPWGLRLVEYYRAGGVAVRPIEVDGNGQAAASIGGLGSTVERAVLTVSGLAPRTLETAGYQVTLRPAR